MKRLGLAFKAFWIVLRNGVFAHNLAVVVDADTRSISLETLGGPGRMQNCVFQFKPLPQELN